MMAVPHCSKKKTVREVAQLYLDAYRTGDTEYLGEIISPRFVDHSFPEFSGGPEGVRKSIEFLHRGFAAIQYTVEDCICDEHSAAIRVVTAATHVGSSAGRPATSRRVTWSACDFLRVHEGKITDLWSVQDTLALL